MLTFLLNKLFSLIVFHLKQLFLKKIVKSELKHKAKHTDSVKILPKPHL